MEPKPAAAKRASVRTKVFVAEPAKTPSKRHTPKRRAPASSRKTHYNACAHRTLDRHAHFLHAGRANTDELGPDFDADDLSPEVYADRRRQYVHGMQGRRRPPRVRGSLLQLRQPLPLHLRVPQRSTAWGLVLQQTGMPS